MTKEEALEELIRRCHPNYPYQGWPEGNLYVEPYGTPPRMSTEDHNFKMLELIRDCFGGYIINQLVAGRVGERGCYTWYINGLELINLCQELDKISAFRKTKRWKFTRTILQNERRSQKHWEKLHTPLGEE